MIGLQKLCVGPKMTDAQFSNDVVFRNRTLEKRTQKVIKLLLYIRVERDLQICFTTDTEHASHPVAC